MTLIIDGYNLMHAAGIIGAGRGPRGLERSRLAVLNFVAEALPVAEVAVTTVVFDASAAPPGLPRQLVHRGVTVRFASGYESADELIEELIAADNTPRRLIVVSSDHRLHRAARRRKAQAIDSDRWYEQTVADRGRRQEAQQAAPQKPATPTAGEVEYWLSRFTDEPPATRKKKTAPQDPGDAIFPQEYLDSISEEEEPE